MVPNLTTFNAQPLIAKLASKLAAKAEMHIKPVKTWAACLAVGAGSAAAAAGPDIAKLFGRSFSPAARIYLTSETNYSRQVARRRTRHAAPSFAAAIKPATVGDVLQNILNLAMHLLLSMRKQPDKKRSAPQG